MNRPLRALLGLAAGAALLSTAPFAAAQDHAPPTSGDMAEKWKEHHHERAEAHAKALHAILNIRQDQEAAFQAFIGSMKPLEHGDMQHGDMHGDQMRPEGGAGEMANLTTPQRLDRMAEMMAKHDAEHQAAFQRHAQAVKTFYAVLSPEQQHAFDALGALHGMHGSHGPEGFGGHDGPGGEDHMGLDHMGPDHMGPDHGEQGGMGAPGA